MQASALKKLFDEGQLHKDFTDRMGLKRFVAANEVEGVIVYSKETKSGPQARDPKKMWHLSRIGVADSVTAGRDEVLYMSTFSENLPSKGTPVVLEKVEYDERDTDTGPVPGLTAGKVATSGGAAPAQTNTPAPSTGGGWSTEKDKRIYYAGCLNTAIAWVGLMLKAGVAKAETEAELSALIASKTAEIETENPF